MYSAREIHTGRGSPQQMDGVLENAAELHDGQTACSRSLRLRLATADQLDVAILGTAARLQVLDLSGVALWSSGVARVVVALHRLPELHTLALSGVHLAHVAVGESGGRATDLTGAMALGESLRHRFSCGTAVAAVETLDLSQNALDIPALHATLARVRGLTALDICQNKLKGRAAAAEVRAVARRNDLCHLRTARNGADVVRSARNRLRWRVETLLISHAASLLSCARLGSRTSWRASSPPDVTLHACSRHISGLRLAYA